MKNMENSARLAVKNGWVSCPYCRNGRLMKVLPDTEGTSIQVFCKHCRKEIILDIHKGMGVELHGQ